MSKSLREQPHYVERSEKDIERWEARIKAVYEDAKLEIKPYNQSYKEYDFMDDLSDLLDEALHLFKSGNNLCAQITTNEGAPQLVLFYDPAGLMFPEKLKAVIIEAETDLEGYTDSR